VIDLHCHVLPGVDDGAPDMATALQFLRAAAEAGTTDLIATSHQHAGRYPNDAATLRSAHAALCQERERLVASGERLPRVHLGAEVHLDGDVACEVAAGQRLRLAGGPYLLLELPDVFSPREVEEEIFRLQLAGTHIVLAHPERIGQLLRQPAVLRRLVERGAIGQVTASSLAGDFGAPCRDVAFAWIGEGLLHVAGSDAHDLKRRPPRLDRARAEVESRLGSETARLMFEERPAAILRGAPLDLPPLPAEPSRPRGWGERLRDILRR
jgi:protein-tyrosine phosphatase